MAQRSYWLEVEEKSYPGLDSRSYPYPSNMQRNPGRYSQYGPARGRDPLSYSPSWAAWIGEHQATKERRKKCDGSKYAWFDT